MKLYFPTSTLNISNMLASSSISPIAFYGKRKFGVPWFEPLDITSDFSDVILLFSKFPLYDIKLTNKESYPMIVEIDLPEQEINKTNIDYVYYVSQTIYISPSSTKFFFLSQTDKQKAMFRISQGEEPKFSELYLPNFHIKSEHCLAFDLSSDLMSSIRISSQEQNEIEVNNDWVRDKLMGALCGYFIGSNGFGDNNLVISNTRMQIKRLIASLIQIFDGKNELIEEAHRLQIKALTQFVNKANSLLDLCHFESSQKFSINYTQNSVGHRKFFEEMIVWVIAKDVVSQEEVSKKGGNVMRKHIEGNWESSMDRDYLTRLFYNVTRYEPFSLDSNQSIILQSFAAFVQRGLGEWEKLIDYLEERSLVIRDRRFIYALFGAYNGFFSLSKTMTDHTGIPASDLIGFIDDMHLHIKNLSYDNATEQRDLKDGVEEVVLNENIKKSDKKKINEALNLEAKQGSTRAFLFILNNLISSKTKTYTELKKQLKESEDSVSPLRDRVFSVLSSIKKVPSDQVKAVEEALDLEQEIGNPKALCYMLDDMKLSEKIQKKFYDYFEIPYKNESKDKNKKDKNSSKATGIKETYVQVKEQGLFDDKTLDELQQEPSSFEIKKTVHFYNDPDAWYYIENLIASDDTCSKIKSDLEWFQEIMQKPQGQRGYQTYDILDENNDKDVIEKFCSLKKGNYKTTGEPKAPYFTFRLRELIKQKLFSIYCK